MFSAFKKFAATSVAIVVISSSVMVAQAQDILVVNATKVLVDSKAGQDMGTKVQAIAVAMQSEMLPEKTALETEGKSLDAARQGKTQEQLQADTALTARAQAYVRKLQTYAQKTDKRAKELAATENNALNTFQVKMAEAVEKVRVEKGGKIVMLRSNVYLLDPANDITSAVIAKLDQDAPTIAVTRVTFPDQASAQN